jgi:hypothetical protein
MSREYITRVCAGSCSASTFILLCYFFTSILAFLCGEVMSINAQQNPGNAANFNGSTSELSSLMNGADSSEWNSEDRERV